ncbi:uncharacterized protein FN964_007484 [Alca torda]
MWGQGPQSRSLSPRLLLQTDGLVCGDALPRNRVVLQEEAHPREAAAPAAGIPAPASTVCKLPALPPAPSASPAGGWEMASSAAACRIRQPVPPPPGTCGERGRPARVRTYRPALQLPTAVKDTARSVTSKVLSKLFTASQGPSQQPALPHSRAHHGAAVIDALWAADSSKARAQRGTGAASRDVGPGHGGPVPQDDPLAPVGLLKSHRNRQARAAAGRVLPGPQDKPGALAKEECKDSWVRTIWVNRSVAELFQDPEAGSQEEPGWPSSPRTEGTAEEGDHPQSASPAPAGPADAEPAASAPAEAPKEDGHLAPLAPEARDEANAPASPVSGERTPAEEPECQVPAPHGPTLHEDALQDTALSVVREVVINAVRIVQSDLAQSTRAETATETGGAPQDTQSPLAGEPQGEAGPTLHEDALQDIALSVVREVVINAVLVVQSDPAQSTGAGTAGTTSPAPERTESPSAAEPRGEASTTPLAPAADEEGDAAASPGAGDPEHQVPPEHAEEAQPCCSCRDVAEEVPGIATLPSAPAPRRRPSLFRRALKALRRAFCCSCITAQKEQ